MITKLSTYITDNTVPYRNLAIEEYLTLHTEPGECILFLWQNRRTVVIGKNQNCGKECKVNYLEEDGGFLVRRLSGGGAVFHDMGNLNFTFCIRREDYDVDRQLEVILQAARLLGLDARKTGRNDVTIEGRKFSGNAFYQAGDFCYHHGTLLLDVNKEDMSRYLNVSREKLQSKGVDSVRSRVANLVEFAPQITVPVMQEKMVQAFGMVYGLETHPLVDERIDWEDVRQKEQRFGSWEWKYGRKIPFQYSAARRFSWGDVELQFEVDSGIVKSVNVFSDGMDPKLVSALPPAWKGCRYEERALLAALEEAADQVQKAASEASAGGMQGAASEASAGGVQGAASVASAYEVQREASGEAADNVQRAAPEETVDAGCTVGAEHTKSEVREKALSGVRVKTPGQTMGEVQMSSEIPGKRQSVKRILGSTELEQQMKQDIAALLKECL